MSADLYDARRLREEVRDGWTVCVIGQRVSVARAGRGEPDVEFTYAAFRQLVDGGELVRSASFPLTDDEGFALGETAEWWVDARAVMVDLTFVCALCRRKLPEDDPACPRCAG